MFMLRAKIFLDINTEIVLPWFDLCPKERSSRFLRTFVPYTKLSVGIWRKTGSTISQQKNFPLDFKRYLTATWSVFIISIKLLSILLSIASCELAKHRGMNPSLFFWILKRIEETTHRSNLTLSHNFLRVNFKFLYLELSTSECLIAICILYKGVCCFYTLSRDQLVYGLSRFSSAPLNILE